MGGVRRWVLLAATMTLAACSPNDPPGGEGRLSIATGGSGGVYQVYGGGLAEMLTEDLPDSPTTAETTSASVDNLLLVAGGDSDVAFSLADTAIDAVRGDQDVRPRRCRCARSATLYSNITQVVTMADSGIESIEDLKGKTVSVGAPNSGTEVIALRLMDGRRARSRRGHRQARRSASGSRRRRCATARSTPSSGRAACRPAAITDSRRPTTSALLPVDRYLDPLREKYGEAYEEAEIEDGEYTGVRPVKTIGVPNLLMVSEDMDDRARARHHRGAVRRQEASWRRSSRRRRGWTPRTGRRSISR